MNTRENIHYHPGGGNVRIGNILAKYFHRLLTREFILKIFRLLYVQPTMSTNILLKHLCSLSSIHQFLFSLVNELLGLVSNIQRNTRKRSCVKLFETFFIFTIFNTYISISKFSLDLYTPSVMINLNCKKEYPNTYTVFFQ